VLASSVEVLRDNALVLERGERKVEEDEEGRGEG